MTKIGFIVQLFFRVSLTLFLSLLLAVQVQAKNQQEIKKLINTIEYYIKLDKLTYPKKENALAKTRELERLSPKHKKVRVYYRKIANRYLQLADQAIKNREFKSAKRYIETAFSINKNNKTKNTYYKKLNQAKKRGNNKKLVPKAALVKSNDKIEINKATPTPTPTTKPKPTLKPTPKPTSYKTITLSPSLFDKKITENNPELNQACHKIVQDNAYIVINSNSKKSYRNLLVRLAICSKKKNPKFKLSHAHQLTSSPFVTIELFENKFN